MIALHRRRLPYILLAAAILLAYGLSIRASFHYDDFSLFRDARVTAASGWWEVWGPMQTRPLTYFTYWLNYQLFGSEPWGWHLFSLLLHLAASLALYAVLKRLVPARVAGIAAALFALHPVQAEAVVYIYARATLIATLFCLVALGLWTRGRYWMALAPFALALAAKEECVAFPALLLLFQLFVTKDRRAWRPIAAMFALALAAGLRAVYVTAAIPGSGAGAEAGVAPLDYLLTQGTVILRYFRLLIFPYGFTVDPGIELRTGWAALAAWGVVAGVAAFAAWRARRSPWAFWLLAGLVLLAPSSSVFPANDLAADRRLYLPLIALAPAAGFLLERVNKRALLAAAAVLLVLTIGRVQVWQTERSLWTEAVERAPEKLRPRIRLARASEPERAVDVLLEAQAMAPEAPAVAAELGKTYMALGRTPEALAEFGRALALEPGDPLALNNRGVALLALGQREVAIQDFERALALDPCLFDARYNLLEAGVRTGPPEACRFTPGQRQLLERSP